MLVVVATAMAALLPLLFADVVLVILALIFASLDTCVAFCHLPDDNSTDLETDGVSEGR